MKKPLYLFLLIPLLFSILAILDYGFVFKAGVTLSCIALLFLGTGSNTRSSTGFWFIPGAFILSIIGDWFLSHMGANPGFFPLGIGLYFLAHVGYLVYALKNGSLNRPFTFVTLAVYLVFFAVVLFPAISDMILLVAVILYLLISCFSVGAAINLCFDPQSRWTYFAGVALILLSDTVISFKEFTPHQQLNFLILPTYYAAHMLITYSVVSRKT